MYDIFKNAMTSSTPFKMFVHRVDILYFAGYDQTHVHVRDQNASLAYKSSKAGPVPVDGVCSSDLQWQM